MELPRISDEQTVNESLTRHEKKEAEREKRESERQKHQEAHSKAKKKNKLIIYSVISLAVIVAAYFLFTNFKLPEGPYTKTPIHWHAKIDIEICGKKIDLPRIPKGDEFLGTHLLHTHDDNVAHIEGQIFRKEDIALGKFFDSIKVTFTNSSIMDKKNGDECEGKQGTLKMFVNDIPSTEFRDYIIQPVTKADSQRIRLVFN